MLTWLPGSSYDSVVKTMDSRLNWPGFDYCYEGFFSLASTCKRAGFPTCVCVQKCFTRVTCKLRHTFSASVSLANSPMINTVGWVLHTGLSMKTFVYCCTRDFLQIGYSSWCSASSVKTVKANYGTESKSHSGWLVLNNKMQLQKTILTEKTDVIWFSHFVQHPARKHCRSIL